MSTSVQPTTEGSTPWAAIAGVIATVSVFAIAQGLTYPLLSFILQRQGVSPGMIGLSAAMSPIGFIASAPFIPAASRRFGAGRTVLACAALAGVTLFLIGWTQNVYAWFVLRFMLGALVNPLYVISETWIISLAPPSRRGRIVGIYTTLISAGFAAGPLSLLVVGTEGWPPFLIGIFAFAICGVSLLLVLPRLPELHDPEGNNVSVIGFMPLAWLLLLTVAIGAGFEQGILALFPIYGAGHGISETSMSALLTVMIAGNIALQVPLGLLAERWSASRVRICCLIATLAGCVLLPILIETPLVWPFIFLWGAVSYGIYTMSIVELGERFTGSMLVAGNAAFAMMWGLGGIAVPPATGVAIGIFGPGGLPLMLGLICFVLTALTLLRWHKG